MDYDEHKNTGHGTENNGLRERDRCKLSTLEPVNGRCVDRYSLLCADIWPILEVGVLAFLLCLQIETSETTEIFLHYGFIDCCSAPDTLTIVVGHTVQMVSSTMIDRSGSRLTMSTNRPCS